MPFRFGRSRRVRSLVRVLVPLVAAGSCVPETALVPPEVSAITVSGAKSTIYVAEELSLGVAIRDTRGRSLPTSGVTWSSGNASVAAVDAQGKVRGVGAGATSVSASAGGRTGSFSLVVIAPVATVSLDPSAVSIRPGQSRQLTASLFDASGNPLTGRSIVWASSQPAIATVSASGAVTALPFNGPDTRTLQVTATSEGRSGTATVTVQPSVVASVSVSPASTPLEVGGTVQLTATPRDTAGGALTGRAVQWTTSDSLIATVTASGLVTGRRAGSAIITATSEGRAGTAGVTLAPVAIVELTAPAVTLLPQRTLQASATTKDAQGRALQGRQVTWASSDTSIAVVSSTGLVSARPYTGATARPFVLTASSEGKVGQLGLSVLPAPVATIIVTPGVATLYDSLRIPSVTLAAVAQDSSGGLLPGRSFDWSSSDSTVASVDTAGVVRGLAGGIAAITARSGPATGSAAIRVPAVATLTVAPALDTLRPDETVRVTVVARDSLGRRLPERRVTWAVADTSIARVDSLGNVRPNLAYGGGAIRLTDVVATSEGRTGSARIGVFPRAVATVEITPRAPVLRTGGSLQLALTPRDTAGIILSLTDRSVAWSAIGSPALLSVSATGVLTAGSTEGSGFVRAILDGRRDSVSVTVTARPVESVVVSPRPLLEILSLDTTVTPRTVDTLTANLKDSLGVATAGRTVTWSSSDTTVIRFLSSTSQAGGTAPTLGVARAPFVALRAGRVRVLATAESRRDSTIVSIPSVDTVLVDSTAVRFVQLSEFRSLTAAVLDSGSRALRRRVSWSSSDTLIATVSSGYTGPGGASVGRITPRRGGTADVTVQADTVRTTVRVTVVPVDSARITLLAASDTIVAQGAERTFRVTLRGASGTVLRGRSATWRSTDTTRLAIVTPARWPASDSVVVRGVLGGSAFLVVSSEGRSDSVRIRVPAVATVSVAPAPFTVDVLERRAVNATVRDEGGDLLPRSVSWTSSDTTVATVQSVSCGANTSVSSCAEVTGRGTGRAWIRAAADGRVDSTSATILPVASIEVATPAVQLLEGTSSALTAIARDSAGVILNNRPLRWQSGNAARLTVGATSGVLQSVGGTGNVPLTVSADGASALVTATIVPLPDQRIAAGEGHGCRIKGAGAVHCWGINPDGRLGDSTTTTSLIERWAVGGVAFRAVSAGRFHTCALTEGAVAQAELYCWGANGSGQLGVGSTQNQSVPTRVSGALRFATVAAGVAHTCGITVESRLFCWGANNRGQLGDNSLVSRLTPTEVAGGYRYVSVDAAETHTCAVTSGGSVRCWGANNFGQLGDSTTVARLTPTLVRSTRPFRSVTVGGISADLSFSCALDTAREAYCWGVNSSGQLGTGTTTAASAPLPVSGGTTFASIDAGFRHACGLTDVGAILCWGNNEYGDVGVGAVGGVRTTPTPIATPSSGAVTYSTMSAGTAVSCGRVSTTSAFCWGFNDDGRVGDGTQGGGLRRPTPVPVASAVSTVRVVPDRDTLVNVGSTRQLAAVLFGEALDTLSGRPVTWSSANPAVATVSSTGLVTSVYAGTTEIVATAERRTGRSTVTVRLVPVRSVVVSPGSATLLAGQQVQLSAQPADSAGVALGGRPVQWSSSDTAAVRVSSTGLLTSAYRGAVVRTASITATIEGVSASITVTVNPTPVATVAVTPATPTVESTDTLRMTATMRDAANNILTDRTVVWASADTLRAVIDSTGKLTARAAGSVSITATSEGRSQSAVVTVAASVATVTVSGASGLQAGGTSVPLVATARNSSGSAVLGLPVRWSSADTAVATVSADSGIVRFKVPPASPVAPILSSLIRAQVQQVQGQLSFRVVRQLVEGDSVIGLGAAAVGDTLVLAVVRPGTGAFVVSTSGGTGDPNLQVFAPSALTPTCSSASPTSSEQCNITLAQSQGGVWRIQLSAFTAFSNVTVRLARAADAVSSVTVTPSAPTIRPGSSVTLTATARNAAGATLSGRPVAWTSSDTAVATVSGSGVVTARPYLGPLTRTVTVSAAVESSVGSVLVTVAPSVVAQIVLSPPSAVVLVAGSSTLSAIPRDSAGAALTGRTVTWSSSDTTIVRITSAGVATGVAVGEAVVRASIGGVVATANVSVVTTLPANSVYTSCLNAYSLGRTTSGVYRINPAGPTAPGTVDAYCDMQTDGGGWMLVLNYLHKGGTNPAVRPMADLVPVLGSTTLGVDESASTSTWGHLAPSLLARFNVDEIRFFGRTGAHNRVIHFKTSHQNTIQYFKTGLGSMSGISSSFTALPNHSANLPSVTVDGFFADQGTLAMTNFPFYRGSAFHWGIRGEGGRWEVDDFPNGGFFDTHHQIWIR